VPPTRRQLRSEPDHNAPPVTPRLQELHNKIVASLADSGYAALAFIGCDVHHNRVILRGSVPSYHLKQLAQVYAQRVDGIGRIDNQLKVGRPEVRGHGPY
jgi:osmotically-inducible protein OsmY